MKTNFNPFSLTGKKFIVTGAASGIGRATSIILSQLGADLIIMDMNSEGLSETKQSCRESDEMIVSDLRETSGIKDLIFDVSTKSGVLNGFVHLAGIAYISPLKSLSEAQYSEVMRVNTFAAIEIAKAFANKKVSNGLPASIVFVSSVYALVGSAGNAGYAMSKAALHGLTRSLAVELAPKKIRVNCVAPGFVKTNMMNNTSHFFPDNYNTELEKLHPLGLGEANDVAYACAFLLSDSSKWVTGSIMSVDGGFSAQ